jgi:hypothetical protein
MPTVDPGFQIEIVLDPPDDPDYQRVVMAAVARVNWAAIDVDRWEELGDQVTAEIRASYPHGQVNMHGGRRRLRVSAHRGWPASAPPAV